MRGSLLILAALLFTGSALSATQPLDSIQAAAENYALTRLPDGNAKHYVTATPLDPRLRLDACGAPLDAFTQNVAPDSSRMTIGVRCSAGNTWTLYVPVSIEVEAAVLVLRRPLSRRARVEPSDVDPVVRRMPGSATTFISDASMLQGHRLKRALPAGTALSVDMLVPDLLVRRGQQVTLIAASGAVEIRAQGQALTEGGVADRVRVQNVTSLKVVEGVVESANVVRVGL